MTYALAYRCAKTFLSKSLKVLETSCEPFGMVKEQQQFKNLLHRILNRTIEGHIFLISGKALEKKIYTYSKT